MRKFNQTLKRCLHLRSRPTLWSWQRSGRGTSCTSPSLHASVIAALPALCWPFGFRPPPCSARWSAQGSRFRIFWRIYSLFSSACRSERSSSRQRQRRRWVQWAQGLPLVYLMAFRSQSWDRMPQRGSTPPRQRALSRSRSPHCPS